MKLVWTTLIIWVILIVLSFFIGIGDMTFLERVGGAFLLAVLATGGIYGSEEAIGTTRKRDTGLMVCHKYGHVGCGRGICPKCGRPMERIYSEYWLGVEK